MLLEGERKKGHAENTQRNIDRKACYRDPEADRKLIEILGYNPPGTESERKLN